MLQAVFNAWRIPDLRRKILFTLGILVIFRILAQVTLPGVDIDALRSIFSQNDNRSSVLNLLNVFSGGTLDTFSIVAMGVYPYITASIIMQLLIPIIPSLTEMSKEGGEQGRNRINRYTHYLTVPLALLQAYGQATLLSSGNAQVIQNFGLFGPGWLKTIALLTTMTAGTMLLVWMGELITEQGIGNGISILIFGGIVARLPVLAGQVLSGGSAVASFFQILAIVAITLVTIAGIVMITLGERRIPVQYTRRVRGNRIIRGGGSTHIPLKVNYAGMIPLIFAVSIMIFPATLASFFLNANTAWVRSAATWVQSVFNPRSYLYQSGYFLMVVAFTYFYTMVIFQQQNIPENLQRQGGFIPGIRPGKPTAVYLQRVLNRITLIGALFLGLVAILPWLVGILTGAQNVLISSTALLIVVGVAIDTMRQLEAQLLMRHYEGFIK
ncbi:MAG: preprotein translocase subunit SecY [Chloroflexota bacterium]|nr:preprotein translocase subunit SecY [Chloroflexota bacterium]